MPRPSSTDEPPTAVACGELAGTCTTFADPSRQVEPRSPVALNALMPDAAAAAKSASMLCASAGVVWSSQYAHELLMIVTPPLIIAFSNVWKLVPPPVNGAS